MVKSSLVLIALFLLLTACGTVATPSQPVALAVTALPVTAATPTSQPTAVTADVVSNTDDAPLPGDPAAGDKLFHTVQPITGMACSTCHNTDTDKRLVGPGLLDIAKRAATRVEGVGATEYIHTSIVNPSAYVVEGYQDIMPKNWGKAFTDDQLNDLMAYLLTLQSPAVASR